MNRIRLLPEHVANQIAAGEVVERPASVVKELVENALDAGATRITVEVQAGGRSLIRVTDDGTGMTRDDALMCLERHATSKIQRAEDLSAISTMGFRGEALPSIASVSRMAITTRERESDSPAATQIIIHGGKMLEVKEAGAPHGTSMEIRQLFYNLPARRKFLRSEETDTRTFITTSRWPRWRIRTWGSRSSRTHGPSGSSPLSPRTRSLRVTSPRCASGCARCSATSRNCCPWNLARS